MQVWVHNGDDRLVEVTRAVIHEVLADRTKTKED
jgi:hypothetical protein